MGRHNGLSFRLVIICHVSTLHQISSEAIMNQGLTLYQIKSYTIDMTGVTKVLEVCYNFFISRCTTMKLLRFFFGQSRILETKKDL